MHFSYFCGMNEEIVFKYFPELDARQRKQIAALGQLYAEWNARINVISRKDMDSLYLHHVLHSLALVRYIRDNGLALTDSTAALADDPDTSSSHQTHQAAAHFLDAGCDCHAGVPVHPVRLDCQEDKGGDRNLCCTGT